MKVIIKLLILLLLIPLISANGLQLVTNTFVVNKTNSVDLNITITLKNEESFSFKNITLQNGNVAFMNKISELTSGSNISFPITLTTNNDFNGSIRIIGSYDTDIGESNITYNANISSSGLDRCNVNLVEGDSLHWFNNLIGEVKLRNIDTGEYFQTIASEGNYLLKFTSPVNFNYQVFKVGLPISQVCNLNVQGRTGLVHNSNYDALLNLNVTIIFDPTTIDTNFPTTNYSLRYDQQSQDIFTIRNTGSKVAKNIRLSGEWFTFDKNNFDVGIGESLNVGYTVKPSVFQTNFTNTSYIKNIQIDGNFPSVTKGITVFVPYFDFSFLSGGGIDDSLLKSFIGTYCKANPDNCPKTLVYLNDSDKNVTFNIGEEAYRESLISEDAFRQRMEQSLRSLAEANAQSSNNDNVSQERINKTSQDVNDLKDTFSDLLNTGWFLVFCSVSVVVVVGLVWLISSQKAKNKIMDVGGYHDGEHQW